ncbi:MAG: aminoacyl-tRNA hydrolase [Candidatus Dormibacteraeota bacterium]|nr:aminoacyl-tRNA hydrolase [Candidatus Dormibacteraeota bacterium]
MTTGFEDRVAAVVDHLVARSTWAATRSSGPGGQRRDKVSTRAELTISAAALEGLQAFEATRLLASLGLGDGDLRMSSQEDRMLARNREIVVERLREQVAAALAPPPARRRPTRPSRSAVREREAGKRQRSVVKKMRQAPEGD